MAIHWKDLSYDEKRSKGFAISAACSFQNLDTIRKELPTLEDFVAFSNVSHDGGSILHLLVKANNHGKESQLDFMKRVMAAYELDKHPEEKAMLLQKRDHSNKLAADFTYTYEFLSPRSKNGWEQARGRAINPNVEDTRTSYEKGKIEMYQYLKEEIKRVLPEQTKEEAHTIARENAAGDDKEWNPYEKGIPVSQGVYLADNDGKAIAYMDGSIHETYPEIRLRNVGNEATGKKESSVILRDLDPESKESLLSQVMDTVDFPEDFKDHFGALTVFEKQYKKMKEDKGAFASYRYFVQNRGIVVFEDAKDSKQIGNSKAGLSYGGYADSGVAEENGKKVAYDKIILRSDLMKNYSENEWILLHELYHRVDLNSGTRYSTTDLLKFGLMLTQQNEHNTVKYPFQVVDDSYPPSEFEKEMTAQLMERFSATEYKDEPLLRRMQQIGKYLSLAKADKVPAIGNRIEHALDGMSELSQLKKAYLDFKSDKEAYYRKEEEIKKSFTGEEQKKQLKLLKEQHNAELRQKNLQNEPTRQQLAAALQNRLDYLPTLLAKLYRDKDNAGQIVLSPNALNLSNESRLLPEEIIASLAKKEITPDELIKKAETFNCSDMLAMSYMVGKLWRDKFGKALVPNELPDAMDLREADISKSAEETAKSVSIFAKGVAEGKSEIEIKTALFARKSTSEITNADRIEYDLHEGIENIYTRIDGSAYRGTNRNHPAIQAELSTLLKEELTKRGYDTEKLPDFMERAGKKIGISATYRNLKEILPYLGQNLTQDAMATVLRVSSYEVDVGEMKASIQEKLANMPNGGKKVVEGPAKTTTASPLSILREHSTPLKPIIPNQGNTGEQPQDPQEKLEMTMKHQIDLDKENAKLKKQMLLAAQEFGIGSKEYRDATQKYAQHPLTKQREKDHQVEQEMIKRHHYSM